MRRDCGLCQPCMRNGHVTAAYAVDHKLNRERGGSDDESNLEAICRACHQAKTAEESRAGRGASKVQPDTRRTEPCVEFSCAQVLGVGG